MLYQLLSLTLNLSIGPYKMVFYSEVLKDKDGFKRKSKGLDKEKDRWKEQWAVGALGEVPTWERYGKPQRWRQWRVQP